MEEECNCKECEEECNCHSNNESIEIILDNEGIDELIKDLELLKKKKEKIILPLEDDTEIIFHHVESEEE